MIVKITSDKKLADQIISKIKENAGYCICSVVKNDSTKCMCEEFLNQGLGACHCGLYIKTEE